MQSIIVVTAEYAEGRQAWGEGRLSNHNPYFTSSCEWDDWQKGWGDIERQWEKVLAPTESDAQEAGYRAYELAITRPGIDPELVIPDGWERWKDAFTRGWREARSDANMFG